MMKSKNKKKGNKTLNAISVALIAKELGAVCNRLKISNEILHYAIKIYAKAITKTHKKYIKNAPLSIKGMAAGALLVALLYHRKYVSISELSEVFNVDRKEIGYAHSLLIRELGIRMPPELNLAILYYLLRKVEEKHVLSYETTSDADLLMRKAYERGVDSKNWRDVAAASIFIAVLKNKERVSPVEIAKAAEISMTKLLARLKELNKKLNLK